MTKFVLRRVLQAIPVLFGITIVVYGILLAAPGGPTAKFANNPKMTIEQKEKFKAAWGLDQPIPVQYCRWMGFCNPEVSGTLLGSLPTPAAFLGPSGLPNLGNYSDVRAGHTVPWSFFVTGPMPLNTNFCTRFPS